MAWSYLHLKIEEAALKRQMSPEADETHLQAYLNMYGAGLWELIYVGRPSTSSYELIFKQKL